MTNLKLIKIAIHNFIHTLFDKRYTIDGLLKHGTGCWVLNTSFEGNNVIMNNVKLNHCSIGLCSYINEASSLSYTKVGRYCSIADHVKVCIGNHPTRDFVTTFPAFYYDTTKELGYTFHQGSPLYKNIFPVADEKEQFQVVIGNDVWIASNVLIVGGVKIGDGAIVGAGSVVVKDVEPYSIVAGNPAKLIRKRFSEEQIDSLREMSWWNFSFDSIKANYHKYQQIDCFLKDEETTL